DHKPEARVDEPEAEINARDQKREAEIVKLRAVGEIDEIAELTAPRNREPVVAAVAVETDCDEIDHLGEGKRDHDEIDAARAQTESADHEREQRRYDKRSRPLQKARSDPLMRQHADHVAADPEIDRVPEAHHAAIAENEVQARRRDREDDDTGEEREDE